MTERMHDKTNEITNHCFPWKERKVKSTEDPWITDEIRTAVRRRKRKFKKHQRSGQWTEAKEHTNRLIKESKAAFYTKSAESLKAKGGGTIPYRILKELAIPDRPKRWTVNSWKPGLSNQDIANNLASYFTRITDEFDPLPLEDVPTTYSSPFRLTDVGEVAERIRANKKPISAVDGDILPSLTNKYSEVTAIPATRIIYHCLRMFDP